MRAGPQRDVALSDATLAVLLRLAAADVLARRGGEAYDDVLAELAGWGWELAAAAAVTGGR